VVVGLGVWGWPIIAQSTRPELWVPEELESVACGRRVGKWLCSGCGALFPARSAVSSAVRSPPRGPVPPPRGASRVPAPHMFLHVLPRSALSELRSGVHVSGMDKQASELTALER
jgi:hypothetical protein